MVIKLHKVALKSLGCGIEIRARCIDDSPYTYWVTEHGVVKASGFQDSNQAASFATELHGKRVAQCENSKLTVSALLQWLDLEPGNEVLRSLIIEAVAKARTSVELFA